MDVYVVSNCWWRDGSSVIGAGADFASAEEVANRIKPDDSRVANWSPWSEDGDTKRRDGLMADGAIHPSLYQEIVRFPLAGVAGPAIVAAPSDGLAGDVRDWVKWSASTEWLESRPTVSPVPDLTQMTEALGQLHAEWLNQPREVRVGDGPAWAWLKGELDKLTTYPSTAPMPDSRAASMIWGMSVILDPNIPDDEIRIGPVRYIFGHDDHLLVKAGQIVRIDTSQLD